MNELLTRKILSPAALAAQLAPRRAAGKTVVHCHGCFDIVHPGHVRYLLFARQLGDLLVVSLTGDENVGKGPDRPYIPQELRAENLAALEFVDFVVIDSHHTAAELLDQIRPDVYVKGREYAGAEDPRFVREKEIVERGGGRVVFHSGDVVFSSTRLIESLQRDAQLDAQRLGALCRRQGIDWPVVRAALAGFAGCRVVVVGDALLERTILCDRPAVAGDAAALELRKAATTQTWGGAAGLALALGSLGARPTLITAVGNDDASRELDSDLSARGVEMRAMQSRRGLPLRETFVADDTRLFKITDAATTPLDSVWEKRAAAAIECALKGAGLLLCVDGGFGMLSGEIVRAAARAARLEHARVVGCATAPHGELTAVPACDLLVTSERQLRETHRDRASGLPSVAWHVLNRLQCDRAIVQMHPRGWLAFDGQSTAVDLANVSTQRSAAKTAPDRLRSEFVPALAPSRACADFPFVAAASLALAGGASLWLATYLAAGAQAACGMEHRDRLDSLEAWFERRGELREDSRFLPDSLTASDIARLAPPLAIPAASA